MSAPQTTKQWIVASKPAGEPTYTGPDPTFKLHTATLEPLKEGQVLAKVLYFSNDTGLRNFIHCDVAPERFYVPTIPLGSPMRSGVIAEVVESASPTYKKGDLVMDFREYCLFCGTAKKVRQRERDFHNSTTLRHPPHKTNLHTDLGTWSEYIVLEAATAQPLAPLPNNLPITHYLGAFGASGLAAYCGLYYAAEAKPSHTIVISAAAGATGSMAVQIAVRLLGAKRVVGIAGGAEKCKWVVEELGAHACVDYKSATFVADLKAATPEEVDVYFDNVGGAVLDAMLRRMRHFGRIAVCGSVATYNAEEPMALRNWFELISGRFTVRGFIMLDYMDRAPAIVGELIAAAADGRIKLGEGETVVEVGIERQPEVWLSLFTGGNKGKLLTKLVI